MTNDDIMQRRIVNRDLSNAANDGVRPAVCPRTEFHEIDGKIVLAVMVPDGNFKPYADKTGTYWTKSGPDKRRIVAREPNKAADGDDHRGIRTDGLGNRTDGSEIRTDALGIRTDHAQIRTESGRDRTDWPQNSLDDVPKAVKKLVFALRGETLFTTQLMERLKIKSRDALSVTYIKPGLGHEVIEMLFPDASRTKKQAYRLTEKGLVLLRGRGLEVVDK